MVRAAAQGWLEFDVFTPKSIPFRDKLATRSAPPCIATLAAGGPLLELTDHRPPAESVRARPRTSSSAAWWRRVVTRIEKVPLLLLAFAATLLWCGLNHRLTPESWRMPVDYSGDSIEVLTRLQAAAEWGVVPTFHNHVARLGAPFGAEWSEYPAADDLLMLFF